jgi:hypothetical protein
MTDRTTFGTMLRQFGVTIPSKDVWNTYITLGIHDAMLLDYGPGGIKIKFVINGHLVEGL